MFTLLKEKLAGGAVKGTFITTNSPAMAEMMGYAGYDFIIIDTEHGPNDIPEVEHMIRAAQVGGAAPLVRVTENSPGLILRALDSGAAGIVVPQVNSAAAAGQVVRAAKYRPLGDRGVAGIVRAARYGLKPLDRHLADANEQTAVIVQIEDVKAVAVLEDILAVEGVDGVLIGPADLSQSMGIAGQFDNPEFNSVVTDIITRVVRAGKIAGIFCPSAVEARRWHACGARLLTIGTDTLIFGRAIMALAEELKEI